MMTNLFTFLNDNFVFIWFPFALLTISLNAIIIKYDLYGSFVDRLLHIDLAFVIIYALVQVVMIILQLCKTLGKYLPSSLNQPVFLCIFGIIVVVQLVVVLLYKIFK